LSQKTICTTLPTVPAKTTAPPQNSGPSAVSRFTILAKTTGVTLETAKVGLAPLQIVDLGTKRLL
jgi:hypothetical protein